MTQTIQVKRIYDPPAPEDGVRILVDHLWPRGMSASRARVDVWMKAIAPSTGLRRWFNHDAQKWEEFKQRYAEELEQNPQAVEALLEVIRRSETVTLLYAARESRFNNAVALQEWLLTRLKAGPQDNPGFTG